MNIRLITLDDGTPYPSWTFGPISIHPYYKRKGYGLKLLQYAIEKAKEMGIGLLQMEGNIAQKKKSVNEGQLPQFMETAIQDGHFIRSK